MLPRGLVVILVMLVSGFGLSLSGSMRSKSVETKYQALGGAGGAPSSAPASAGQGSYQSSASDGYAIPAQQKDVTYCVIDGRLVDQ